MANDDKKLIKILKKFPDQNPNPVIKISDKGILEYFNGPSIEIVEFYGLKLDSKVNDIFLNHIQKTISNNEHGFEMRIQTQSFYFKSIYIKELQSINLYGTDITAKRVIDKFPDSNPNPVLRITYEGKLNYFNKASEYIIDVLKVDLNISLPDSILNHIKSENNSFELKIGSKDYLFNLVKIGEFNFYLLYGTDITDTKDKEKILQKLSKYFSPQVYNSIFSGQLDVTINTSRKNLTVFFSDIKSFTTITEKLEPEVLTELITTYLTEMTNIAIEHGGTVDKYIGDAIMIFFGDPNSNGTKNDAIACVSMALKMKKALRRLRKNWKSAGLSESLHVRMGIHTDVCTVGNFGSLDRLDYTVLGNGVNLASRLESLAGSNEILISENTYNLVKGKINCNYFDVIKAKGKSHSIKAFQVVDVKSKKGKDSRIKASAEGFDLSIDRNKIKNMDEIIDYLEKSIEKLNDQ